MKIEVFYTGGGITLAEADLGERYAVVSTECPECIAIYNKVEGEEPYMPEDMVASLSEEEMDEETKALYLEMLGALKNA
jgi:hypothetical protein